MIPMMKIRTVISSIAGALTFFNAFAQDFDDQREKMVQNQIIQRGVDDSRVLKAMREVERHKFVPEAYRKLAYADRPLPIGQGQTISQPYIVALMTAELDPGENDIILEIGAGSGYQAAVLAKLCKEVYTIEIEPELGARAQSLLNELGYDNIHVRIGDGYQGWPEHAPFDAIIVTASPSHIPQPLINQLKEGGKMIIPVGEGHTQELILLEKKGKIMRQKNLIPVRFVPFKNQEGERY